MRNTLKTMLAAATLGFAGAAAAADLPRYLPAETLFAVGVEGLAEHEAKARPFIEEWERLDLTELLAAAFAEESDLDVPEVVDLGIGLLDVLGREAWVAVSATRFNPLPTLTFLAEVTPEGMAAAREGLAELGSEGDVQQMTEGGVTFTVVTPDEDDPTPVVYALFDDVVLVTTNPDVARGVLRRYQGSDEPSLATNSGYLGTVGTQRAGNAYLFLDLAAAVDVVKPFAAGLGFDGLVERLAAAAGTSGAFGSLTRVTDEGLESVSVRVLGGRASDPLLYDLLAASSPVTSSVLGFTPPTALGVQAASVDLPGWWDWLEDVVASEPTIGITDLDEIALMMLGLDLQGTLFGWMGDEFATVTLSYGQTSALPTSLTDPLGETVYLVATTDEDAAVSGLNELFTLVTSFASAFMDPMGEGAMVAPAERTVAGVSVTDWRLADGFTLSVAAVDGYALIGTSASAMDAVLTARAGGAGLGPSLAPLYSRLPAGATAFGLSDDSRAVAYAADAVVEQLGMLSGIAGGDVDFDAVEAATAALSEFLDFLVDRLGGSVSWTTVNGDVVRSEGFSSVHW